MYSSKKLFYTLICQQILLVIEILYLLMFFNQRFVIMQKLNVNLTLLFTFKRTIKRKDKVNFETLFTKLRERLAIKLNTVIIFSRIYLQ